MLRLGYRILRLCALSPTVINRFFFSIFVLPTVIVFKKLSPYFQNISSARDTRIPIYMTVVARTFDLRQILVSMSKINWEVKDVMSQHNSYVDMILRTVQIFTLRLEEVVAKVPVNAEVSRTLWENIAHIITHTLVQGYWFFIYFYVANYYWRLCRFSEAKKCSNGGRALMQLDFTQFLSKFEKISSLRPVPHKEYVENYVKAFYLPEVELEKWIREHKVTFFMCF